MVSIRLWRTTSFVVYINHNSHLNELWLLPTLTGKAVDRFVSSPWLWNTDDTVIVRSTIRHSNVWQGWPAKVVVGDTPVLLLSDEE